jgi:hypothetical protein
MSRQVDFLAGERDHLVRRVQHLEAIVTSEAWDTLGTDPALASSKADGNLLEDIHVESEAQNERQATAIARRLRG